MEIVYNNTVIRVDIQDSVNPLFSAADIRKALGIRDKTSGDLLDRYGVIRLMTKRNRPDRDLFRRWFIREFSLWFGDPVTKITVTPTDSIEEIDECDVADYITANCFARG